MHEGCRMDETVQGKTGQHQEMNRQFSPCVELTVSPQTKMRTPLSCPQYYRLEPDVRRVELNEYLFPGGRNQCASKLPAEVIVCDTWVSCRGYKDFRVSGQNELKG